jgi:hypothetical protein
MNTRAIENNIHGTTPIGGDMNPDSIGFIDGCGFGSDFTCEDSGNKRGYGNGCSIGHGARDGSGGHWPRSLWQRIESNHLCGYGCGGAEGSGI